jgi:methylmalonyl-CoA mutase
MTSIELTQPEDAHAREEWEKAAAGVLRKSGRLGDDDPDALVWDRLTRTTLDGIGVTPLGVAADVAHAVGERPARSGPWDIRSLIADPDAQRAHEAAIADLEGGVTSLWLYADEATDLARILEGVFLDLAPVVLDAPTATVAVAQAFLAYVEERGLVPHPDTNLGADPLGALLRDHPVAVDEAVEELRRLATLAREAGVRALVVDATAAHDLGASDGQELGWSIAVGVAYLRWLSDHGLSVAHAAGLVEFRYAATDEQFPTIAKLRAARRLWARVLELSGVEAEVAMRIHAATSRPMLSKYDPYVNMLRGTVAGFAAGVGGADAVTVLPFDSANGRPEPFGRRIARNVSHLLIDESHVAAVADPAGGAYAVERLTDELAQAGWAEFQRIEREWEAGRDFTPFRERVAATVAQREKQIARRKRPITGLSEFPHLAETLPEREPDPLNDAVRRYGASFEELRDNPPAAHVFLATLGPIAQHTARATFASNLLAAGGVAVDVAGPTSSPEDLVAAYRGQPVVCLAGADRTYAEWGQAAAEALRAAGAAYVVVAGQPGALGNEQSSDDSCAMGVDALAFLHRVREKLS